MSELSDSENVYYCLSHELLALKSEMKRLDLWQAAIPHPTVLGSTQPFSIDTLTLPQWLQFIFVPRITALIEANGPLPTACGIKALAEETIGREEDDSGELLGILGTLDQLLTRDSAVALSAG
ncbi:MAG: YqcC family protein [Pseudomonadales bacterium]